MPDLFLFFPHLPSDRNLDIYLTGENFNEDNDTTVLIGHCMLSTRNDLKLEHSRCHPMQHMFSVTNWPQITASPSAGSDKA
jgi:hypothetical protein